MKTVFIIFVVLCNLVIARNAYDSDGNYRGSTKDGGAYNRQGKYGHSQQATNVYESANSHRKNTDSTRNIYDSQGRYKETKNKRGRSDTILIDREGNEYRGSQYEDSNKNNSGN